MIEVQDLWQAYGRVDVLRGVSFSVPTGQIAGFLGPNGAGKTTTMRLLTTFMPLQRGVARVAGCDVAREPKKVCQKVGYLPESMPVYPELQVREYLRHRATLRGVPRAQIKARVDELIEECALADVRRKLLGALSRGYRQRLGLADCLLHDPEILILDEPTAGLDPRQVVEVRRMIEACRGRRTVLLSSHILGEVEQVCDTVIILHDGKVQAQESRESWQERVVNSGHVRLVLSESPEDVRKKLRGISGVRSAVETASNSWEIRAEGDRRAAIFELVKREGWRLLELTPVRVTLETLFLELTGQAAPGDANEAEDQAEEGAA